MPAHGEGEKLDFEPGSTNWNPRDVEPAIPPYEGRKTSAESGEKTEKGGARTGGATAPTTALAPRVTRRRCCGVAASIAEDRTGWGPSWA